MAEITEDHLQPHGGPREACPYSCLFPHPAVRRSNLLALAGRDVFRMLPLHLLDHFPPQISVPTIEDVSYCRDRTLRETLTDLPATASKKETMNLAHAGFTRVTEHWSPDWASCCFTSGDRIRSPASTDESYGKIHWSRLDRVRRISLPKVSSSWVASAFPVAHHYYSAFR
jgi:hypothetical protein